MAGLEGKTLDHYTLERLIGRGGMADVYEGYDPFFHRKVAVKVFKREDEELLQRFIREANLMASLSNGHLVPIYGSGQTSLERLTSTGDVLGTVDYVAPELFEADRKADALSDLYSLGVLLFEMVTGRLPFYAENQIAVVTMHVNKRPPSPRVLNSNVTPQVERVMLKALEKKPEQRYQSATELAGAFCRAISAANKNGISERKAESLTPFIGANRAEPPLILRAPPMPALQEAPPVSPVPNWVNRPLESSPLARVQRRPKPANPARRRAVVVSILAVLCLCIVAIPVFILYANSRNNPGVATI